MDGTLTPSALDGVELFAGLPLEEKARLAAELKTMPLRRGDVLVRQDEPADTLFIVVSGRFAVTVRGRRDPVAELGAGQPVGEIAFLAGGQRTATVTALRDSLVLKLGREEFERLSQRSPAIWRALTIRLAQRVAEGNLDRVPRPDPRPRTIALLRAGGSRMPSDFVDALVAQFRKIGTVALMGAEVARGVPPYPRNLESSEATAALNALENAHDYVLFIADDDLTAWSEKVIRQADLVLAIGQHSAPAEPNALERRASELLAADAIRLVLLHPRRGTITDTARWLAPRRILMHHHVARDEAGDVARVCRFIAGTALGLVACGGGAYCAAHIGVYKALLDAGLGFDIMGGTSGGAAMTAAFAMGASPDQVDEATHDIFVTNRAMRRYTWPRYSLLDHAHFDAQLARHYGGINIEDLWIPYFSVSTDLSSYDLHRHRQGDLWSAVRATGSVPVLLPPFYTADGHMLVDGALLDNVPVKVMHELKSGPNVVISFAVPKLERFDVNYGELPGRVNLIKALLNPLGRHKLPPAPGVATVLMRAMMSNRHDFERHLGPDDLVLVPPIPEGMGVLHWHRHRELMEVACSWTEDELARLSAQAPAALQRFT